MDMSLLVMDGWEAIRTTRSGRSHAIGPGGGATVHAMRTDREQAAEAGCLPSGPTL